MLSIALKTNLYFNIKIIKHLTTTKLLIKVTVVHRKTNKKKII